jgi:hypothetical protein
MVNSKLNLDSDFLVKESRSINFVAGGAMIAVFFICIMSREMDWYTYIFAAGVFLIPGALAIARGRKNDIIMKISRAGIYYGGEFVTDWKSFYDARVTDDMKIASIKDNFILKLRHYSADRNSIHTRDIPLSNKQDKAEEEIIEAIRFYYSASKW